jgi:hypothetical protein
MDEKYLHTLRRNVILALKKVEASLYNDTAIDFDGVVDHVKLFQDYLEKYIPENPSDELKTLVYDILQDVQILSDRITDEISVSKIKISENITQQRIMQTYTQGVRK